MVVCRGRQKVGPHTRPAVCRRLLEMERGPGQGWARVQVGGCTDTLKERLSREILKGGWGEGDVSALPGPWPTFHSHRKEFQTGAVTFISSNPA